MKPRHIAVVSGLVLTLTLGVTSVVAPAFADTDVAVQQQAAEAVGGEDAATGGSDVAAGAADDEAEDATADAVDDAGASSDAASTDADADTADDASDEQLPEPADYDKADFYEDTASTSLLSTRSTTSSSLTSVSVSSEMKYFTKYESHSNYRQGFSSGDGYNALGYYQFDRRYALIPFLTAVYNANPSKYAMLASVVNRGSEIQSASSLYDSEAKTLTSLGTLVQDAWYAAYDADPVEFAAFQDSYAYNTYYVPTEQWLKSALGIDMSGRADCVKGMVWGLSNLWGTSGVRKILRGANLSNDMTDAEFVTALSEQMTDNIEHYSSQTQYYAGWRSRYKNELNDCLAYLALADANDAADGAATGSGTADAGEDVTDNAAADAGADDDQSDAADDAEAEDEPAGGSATVGDSADAGLESGGAGDSTADSATDNSDASDSTADPSSSDAGADESGDADGGSSDADDVEGGAADNSAADDGNANAADIDADDPSDDVTDTESAENASGDNDSTDEAADSETDNSEETTSSDSSSADASSSDKAAEEDDKNENAAQQNVADDASAAGGSTDDTANDADDDDADEAANMPQTSDLIMFAGLASASAATFGATFIAAGKAGLRKRKPRA